MFEKLKYSPIKENTTRNLIEILRSGKVDVNPDYQRLGEIWKKEKKQLLIDSIINNYDIPKIYFHYLASTSILINDSNKLVAIIDGKQRIEAIQDFVENKFGLSENFVFIKDPSVNLKGYTYQKLQDEFPKIAYDFDDYIFDFVFIETDERERIEELFLRLNEGVPLNNAERRKSFGGFLVNYSLKEINQLEFFTSKIAFENKRLEHFDLYTKLILVEHSSDLKSFTKATLDKMIKDNKLENEEIKVSLDSLNERLRLIASFFKEKDQLLKSKSIIPLYYLFFFFEENNDSFSTKIKYLRTFDNLRKINRKETPHNNINQVLIEFDRLNQQGANQKKSLEKRLTILSRFYMQFKTNPNLTIETKIKETGLGLKRLVEDKDI
jgi:hypothetical protein